MKFSIIASLLSLALASPLCERQTNACVLAGTRGRIPAQIDQRAFRRVGGSGTVEACRALCHTPENAACRSFGIRQSGGTACLLFDFDLTPNLIVDNTQATVFYVLPALTGGTPHNNPAWYDIAPSKDFGTYAGCRGYCINDVNEKTGRECLGFAYKPDGNCRVFDTSLGGRVSTKENSGPYIHGLLDCAFLPPPAKAGTVTA